MDGEKWKRAHALSEQALSTMKSRWEHQGSALIAGIDGEEATIRKMKCEMEYACKAYEEKQAELNEAQQSEMKLKHVESEAGIYRTDFYHEEAHVKSYVNNSQQNEIDVYQDRQQFHSETHTSNLRFINATLRLNSMALKLIPYGKSFRGVNMKCKLQKCCEINLKCQSHGPHTIP